MVKRDTVEPLAFGLILVVAISGAALGFNAVADGGPLLDRSDASVDDGGTVPGGTHDGGDDRTGGANHHDDGDHNSGGDAHSDGGGHHGGGMDGGGMSGMMEMRMVENGTVINGNSETLPPGCDGVAGERSVTVHGGVEYADGGETFSFDRDRLEFDRCTRVRLTFVNEDDIRHQWMLHGLPADVYPMGMFNVEVDGPGSVTGTFVTPGRNVTLNTHCSLPQHEQKGMQMSVVVGAGGESAMDH